MWTFLWLHVVNITVHRSLAILKEKISLSTHSTAKTSSKNIYSTPRTKKKAATVVSISRTSLNRVKEILRSGESYQRNTTLDWKWTSTSDDCSFAPQWERVRSPSSGKSWFLVFFPAAVRGGATLLVARWRWCFLNHCVNLCSRKEEIFFPK